jgi:hypothetical protein
VRHSAYWRQRQIACGLLVFLAAPVLARSAPLVPGQQEGSSTVGQAQTTTSVPEAPTSVKSQTNNDAPQQNAPQPVGTAAAPYENTVGAAASRPAGAVIAPAKQRRAHSLLIKLGLIAGGAVAIGTVVALSKGSPSRPN